MPSHRLKLISRLACALVAAAGLAKAVSPAEAALDPKGLWIDHTKRGAVEITDCGGRLCGKVVWVKDAADAYTCGKQVIGNARPSGSGKWTGGWIYDPEEKARYDLVITSMGVDKLKLVGIAAFGLGSEAMIWTRATAELPRCG